MFDCLTNFIENFEGDKIMVLNIFIITLIITADNIPDKRS